MTTKTPTPKAVVKAVKPAVNALLLATVLADMERERVDAIQRKLLSEEIYYGTNGPGEKVRVTDPKVSYWMDKVSSEKYFARLNGIHLAEGFEKAAEGHCPALTAESLKSDAERALIAAAEPFIGISSEALWSAKGGLEKRREYLDLLIKLVVNSPGYRSPMPKRTP